jgi:two-component system nitrogen regulation response regulator GlnG
MQETYRLIARLVTTDLSVLITGESGTGKELVARVLHDHGSRRHGNFVAINMAAIPKELIESELFGHEKGAFTGATTRQAGRFEQADHGTLLLDEIGDMPFEAQTRLLRVLQEGEYTSVGGRRPIRTDVRIIAATNHNLRRLVEQGLFREDLYYRLNVAPLRLPALRERTADIPDLVRHFLAEAAAAGLPHKVFEPAALDRLERYGWPGNVRELENLVRRVTALAADDSIGADVVDAELADASDTGGATESAENLGAAVERQLSQYFAAHPGSLPPAGLYGRVLREIERPLLTLSLQATGGNQIRAAALLGLNRNTLRKKVRELEIPVVRGLK